MAQKPREPKYVRADIVLSKETVPIYAGVRVAHALNEVKDGMDLHKGVRDTASARKRAKKCGIPSIGDLSREMKIKEILREMVRAGKAAGLAP